jgi:hypothetical protein
MHRCHRDIAVFFGHVALRYLSCVGAQPPGRWLLCCQRHSPRGLGSYGVVDVLPWVMVLAFAQRLTGDIVLIVVCA